MQCGTAVLAFVLATSTAHARDTLRVTMQEADVLLATRSLALVAERYNIDRAEAERIQARVLNNPSIATEWSVRPSSGSFFDVGGHNGQKAITVEQILRIGGQRSLAARAAAQRTRLSEAEYAELAAALRYQLHAGLYRQHFLQRTQQALGSQLGVLKDLVDGYGTQLEKGNVSLREVARLRTSYFNLNDQRTRLLRELNAVQEQLGTLLAHSGPIAFAPTAADLQAVRPLPTDTARLFAGAEEQRARVNAARARLDASDLDLKYQKRLALPDLALGGTYDQNSNYLPDYWGLNAGISIPLFDRNQGNVARARAVAEQSRTLLDLERLSVRNEVQRAYADLRTMQEQHTGTSRGFAEQLDRLSGSLIDNYIKSNISLIEFTDLFESYNASIIAINELESDLHSAYEELEYVSGQQLFPR